MNSHALWKGYLAKICRRITALHRNRLGIYNAAGYNADLKYKATGLAIR
jgi:hypothetical protein